MLFLITRIRISLEFVEYLINLIFFDYNFVIIGLYLFFYEEVSHEYN